MHSLVFLQESPAFMKAVIVIPARYASVRLPGKPLLAETGKPLIMHVYEQAVRATLASDVIVATDDTRISRAVRKSGGNVVMTDSRHRTGTMRVAEVAEKLDAEIIVNLQGDEPETDPAHLDRLIGIQATYGMPASTLAARFDPAMKSGPGSPEDPCAVKVIPGKPLGENIWYARYFTRHLQVFPRDGKGLIVRPDRYFMHAGVYAFSRKGLSALAAMPPGALEVAEDLEQLRILETGQNIAVGEVSRAMPGIDTREDYRAFTGRHLRRNS